MQREKWIDVLKGMGIVCVAMGHAASTPLLVQAIFMFHMPLFFLVGGWLHRASMPQREYFRGRAAGLLLPYLSYLMILWPLELLAAYPGQAWDSAFIAHYLFKPMLLGGPLLKGFAAVFWFVTCYFVTQQLVHWVVRHFTRKAATWLFIALLACAYAYAWWWPQRWLPWSAHTVLFTAPIYYLGFRAREIGTIHLNHFVAMYVAIALAGVGLNLIGLHNRLDLKYLDYGLPLVTLASALAMCTALAWLALKLAGEAEARPQSRPLRASMQVLSALGMASMTIMFTHQFVQLTMKNQLGIDSTALRVAAALAVGWLLHAALLRRPLPARLFIGTQPPRRTTNISASMATGA